MQPMKSKVRDGRAMYFTEECFEDVNLRLEN